MTLKTYHQKRNFKKTTEPKGKALKSKKSKHLYVIQKHAASHLHYDFRLELNGVLLSWAIPKGPSLDPTIRRLAMHVEDHPIEYGSFEGVIPKGQYGGGTVMLWDKGKWLCEDSNPYAAYHKGSLTFTLKAKKLNGRWKLIRINNDDKAWLLIKIKDEYAKPLKKYDITIEQPNSVLTEQSIDDIANNYNKIWGKNGVTKRDPKPKKSTARKKSNLSDIKINLKRSTFPTLIHPQLATLVDKPPTGKNWIHEIKFDGYRLIAYKKGKKVNLLTRNNNDWTNKFKSLANAISQLPIDNLVLDGEVVVLDNHQHSDFQLLQNAIQEQDTIFYYYIFDLIYFSKFNLMSLSLIERKSILENLINSQDSEIIRYSDHVSGAGKDVFNKSCKLGLEGIVSKNSDSIYSQKRDTNWLKIKCIKRQEFVIGGFNKSTRRQGFRSLMLGTFNKSGELNYNGNVGTGFTNASLQSIYTLLLKNTTDKMPFTKKPPGSKTATWVKPILVAEIEFTEWTDSDTLRHPSFKGIRKDKLAKNVTIETKQSIEKITGKHRSPAKIKKSIIFPSYQLTHPNKILYPEDKLTKQAIAEYYETIQEWILPYIINRPLTLVRCPRDYKQCFYQKHISQKIPEGLYEALIKEKNGKEKYLYIKDYEGLQKLPQLGVLEIHPWGSQVGDIEYPDIITFDLDPAPKVAWKKVVQAAFTIKAILEEFKLKSFVKTTGGKGLHVIIPIKAEYEWSEIKNFSHTLVKYLVMNNSKEYIDKMAKSARKGKIFIDYLRNQRGATSIAPYSTRARIHAPVATPISWDELTNDIRDTFFTINTLPERLQKIKKDPWQDFFKLKQSLRLNKLKI